MLWPVIAENPGLLMNEIHRYRIPRTLRNQKLFQQTIGFMALRFSTHISSTRLAVLFDGFSESEPSIILKNETSGFVLTGMSRKYVIVLVMKDTETEVG